MASASYGFPNSLLTCTLLGPIFQVRLLRDDLVVVSDPKIAEELVNLYCS